MNNGPEGKAERGAPSPGKGPAPCGGVSARGSLEGLACRRLFLAAGSRGSPAAPSVRRLNGIFTNILCKAQPVQGPGLVSRRCLIRKATRSASSLSRLSQSVEHRTTV